MSDDDKIIPMGLFMAPPRQPKPPARPLQQSQIKKTEEQELTAVFLRLGRPPEAAKKFAQAILSDDDREVVHYTGLLTDKERLALTKLDIGISFATRSSKPAVVNPNNPFLKPGQK
jgi:hypothetical protein